MSESTISFLHIFISLLSFFFLYEFWALQQQGSSSAQQQQAGVVPAKIVVTAGRSGGGFCDELRGAGAAASLLAADALRGRWTAGSSRLAPGPVDGLPFPHACELELQWQHRR
jgi:hypothetical protein